mmetsp:Transcript_56948/g.180181  ORF Transcript_56948/g.180181 Transcript_56948/m.180181 type:complete len:344 (+) Transcript_56948:281-1312(+)
MYTEHNKPSLAARSLRGHDAVGGVGLVQLVDGGLVEVVEVWVVEGLLGGYPLRGVVLHHVLQEGEAVGAEVGDHAGEGLPPPLGKLVPVAEAGDPRPRPLGGRAEQLEDVQELLQLRVAREERGLARHLRKDAPHAPHVHGGGVVGGAEQDLGGAVPQGHDLVGVGFDGHGEGAAQAKVRNLQDVLSLVHQEILGLEVPVHDPVPVAVRHALEELVHEVLDGGAGQRVGRATAREVHVLLEVRVEVLEDQVEDGLVVLLHVLDREEANHVDALAEHLQEGDLAKGGGRDALLLHLEAGLLQGHQLAGLAAAGLVHLAIGALPDLLELLVLIHGVGHDARPLAL